MDDQHRREMRAMLERQTAKEPNIDIHDNQITINQGFDAETVERLIRLAQGKEAAA